MVQVKLFSAAHQRVETSHFKIDHSEESILEHFDSTVKIIVQFERKAKAS